MPSSGSGASVGPTAGCGVPWLASPCSPCLPLSPVCSPYAAPTKRRVTATGPGPRPTWPTRGGQAPWRSSTTTCPCLCCWRSRPWRSTTRSRARDRLAAVLLRSPSLLSVRGGSGSIVDLTASPDGSLLAASRPGDGKGLLLMDAATFEPMPFDDDIPASGIAFSPDSSLLAMAVNQWTGNVGAPARIDPQPVRLYDMPDGTRADRQLDGFPAGASVEYDLDFSADGRSLVAAVDQFDAAGTRSPRHHRHRVESRRPGGTSAHGGWPGGAPGPQAQPKRDPAVRRGHRHRRRPARSASTTWTRVG